MTSKSNSNSTDWVRQGVSLDPETHEDFTEIVERDSHSAHLRELQKAFVEVYELYREHNEFVNPKDIPSEMVEAVRRDLEDRRQQPADD